MDTPDPNSTGAASFSALFDNAISQLPPQNKASGFDSFLYSGNRHDSVPRALLLDKRLTPLERNAWQVFRLMLNQDGVTAFPTYDQLCPYLASTPCTAKASHETVARALTILRLARWLSLVRRQRDPKTGRIRGNLYVLHDEPLTPFEAMQLDPDYLKLISHALDHASKAIQRVGSQVLKDFTEDPMLQGRLLPTRLQLLAQRMNPGKLDAPNTYPQAEDIHESEEGFAPSLRNGEQLSSESEPSVEARKTAALRNPNQDRTKVLNNSTTVLNSNITYSVRTVLGASQELRLPKRFLMLKDEQRSGALKALQHVDVSQRQSVLDEWTVRCGDGNIRNPAGYLFGIIQKAMRGEFKSWAWPSDLDLTTPNVDNLGIASQSHSYSGPASADIVDAQLEQLRSMLQKK